MWTPVILSSILVVAAAQSFPPVELPSTCASTLCIAGTSCREVLNAATGVVRGQCLSLVPVSGNERACALQGGQPLLVDRGNGDLSEVNCGRSPSRTACPSGYSCNIAPNDAYAVCCLGGAVPVEKPGTCPAPRGDVLGICASTCSQDSECSGTDKCCKNPCGAFTCQAPESPRPSCDTVTCGPAERCVLRQVLCVRAPCYPVPVCVADSKPGSCPVPRQDQVGICANTCSDDSDCKGEDKCCKNACGATTCQAPQTLIPSKPSCDTVKCRPGQKCVLKEVQCIRAPCYPQPRCVRSKPGSCPVPRQDQVGICANTCSDDSDCKGEDKCCKNACGATTCQAPQTLIPSKPSCDTVKCGHGKQCKMQVVYCFAAPCPPPQPVCVPVEKAGECPRPRFNLYSFRYCRRTRCRFDSQCPGDQKCCKTLCGDTTCQDPQVTCATVDCEPDHVCVMKEQCSTGQCRSRPVCEPVKRCPFYPAWINPNCLRRDECEDQGPSTCPSGTICCSTDCGRRCVSPLE